MERASGQRDVNALRTAIVCVGLSGAVLGAFAALVGHAAGQMPSLTLVVVSIALGVGVAALGVTRRPAARLSRPQRIVAYWLLAAVLVLELMIPLNFVAGRRHTSFDWTESELRDLSDYTRSIIARVKKPLRITTVFLQQSENERDPRFGLTVFNITRELLEEYADGNPLIAVEHLDLVRDQDKLVLLQNRLKRPAVPGIILEYGGKVREIDYTRLLRDFVPGEMPFAGEPSQDQGAQTAFRGEETITGAILELTDEKRSLLCFVTGHDELSVFAHQTMRRVGEDLRRRNYAIREVEDLAAGVPDNCSVLMVVDPKAPFSDDEIAVVRDHLGRGGKLFYSVGAAFSTGLEQVLADFGFALGRGLVIDPALADREFKSFGGVTLYPTRRHEVVDEIGRLRMVFFGARPTGALPPPPGVSAANYRTAVNLLMTSPNCWSERDLDHVGFDRATDKAGPLAVAAAHEQPETDGRGNPWPEGLPRTRIVAVGCGDFMVGYRVPNPRLQVPPGNREFFFRAVDWLAEKRYLMHIKPKPMNLRVLDEMTAGDVRWVFWLTTAIIPGGFLVLGSAIWLVRRR